MIGEGIHALFPLGGDWGFLCASVCAAAAAASLRLRHRFVAFLSLCSLPLARSRGTGGPVTASGIRSQARRIA